MLISFSYSTKASNTKLTMENKNADVLTFAQTSRTMPLVRTNCYFASMPGSIFMWLASGSLLNLRCMLRTGPNATWTGDAYIGSSAIEGVSDMPYCLVLEFSFKLRPLCPFRFKYHILTCDSCIFFAGFTNGRDLVARYKRRKQHDSLDGLCE